MVNRNRDEGKDYVLKMAKEHDVKFIRLWFTDILGMLKSFAITVEELEGALEEGWALTALQFRGLPGLTKAIWWHYPTLIHSSYCLGDHESIVL